MTLYNKRYFVIKYTFQQTATISDANKELKKTAKSMNFAEIKPQYHDPIF